MTRPVQFQETTPIMDIASALQNLGAKKARALAAAEHACRNYPEAGFEEQFRVALREVA
jgi:hypothetical protein